MNIASQNLNVTRQQLLGELDSIIFYWHEKMQDYQNKGFYGRRDGNDNLVNNAPKGVILNTRILWTFSRIAIFKPLDGRSKLLADRAYKYLTKFFLDDKHGGIYWMVNYQGEVIEDKKQIYAQAFAIYAFTEYYRMSGNQESLDIAKSIFNLVEKHSLDSPNGGYLEAFDRKWNLLGDLRLSEKDANEKKTMNTHLHLLEAYTSLYKSWKDPYLHQQLSHLIKLFCNKIISPEHHLILFFDEHWNVRSEKISFGHDIECSWLLLEAAEVLGEPELIETVKVRVLMMVDKVMHKGLYNGTIINEIDGEDIDYDRHWWPQAEALVGFTSAWQITGNQNYLGQMERVWKFINEYIIDREHGEWHWKINKQGDVDRKEDKAGSWKGPYHNSRAIIELIERLT